MVTEAHAHRPVRRIMGKKELPTYNLQPLSDSERDVLWKQYQLHVDLYKHYLELVLKFNVFYYAATGALPSFYFSKSEVPLIKYSLLFPVAMSVGFGILFIYGAVILKISRQDIFDLRDKLALETAPDVRVLAVLLYISAIMMLGVASVMLWLVLKS